MRIKYDSRRGKFGLRDTGIFREIVPLDPSALVTDMMESYNKPGRFLEDCEQLKKEAQIILDKRRKSIILPTGEFDEAWLSLPPRVSDAFRLILAVDWLHHLLQDAHLVRACRDLGRDLFDVSAAAERIRQLPEDEAERLRFELGQHQIVEIAGNALQIGKLSQRMMVRPREAHAITGKRVEQGGRKGAKRAHGTRRERQLRHAVYQTAVDELSHRNPNMSHTAICRRLAAERVSSWAVSAKTIQRYTRKPVTIQK